MPSAGLCSIGCSNLERNSTNRSRMCIRALLPSFSSHWSIYCRWLRSIRPFRVMKTIPIIIMNANFSIEQQGEITIDEADAILVAENYTRIVYKNRIPLIDFPKKINTHAIRIAHLYTKMYVFIRNCVEICGLFYYTVSCSSRNLFVFLYF